MDNKITVLVDQKSQHYNFVDFWKLENFKLWTITLPVRCFMKYSIAIYLGVLKY